MRRGRGGRPNAILTTTMQQNRNDNANEERERGREESIQSQEDAALLHKVAAKPTQGGFRLLINAIIPGRRVRKLLVRDIEGVEGSIDHLDDGGAQPERKVGGGVREERRLQPHARRGTQRARRPGEGAHRSREEGRGRSVREREIRRGGRGGAERNRARRREEGGVRGETPIDGRSGGQNAEHASLEGQVTGVAASTAGGGARSRAGGGRARQRSLHSSLASPRRPGSPHTSPHPSLCTPNASTPTSVFFTGEISPESEIFLPLTSFWRNLDPKKIFLSPKIHPF